MNTDLIEIRQTAEGVAIRLAGDIDMTNADGIGEQIDDAITNQATLVEVDLAEVTYLDSAGLRVLSNLAGRLQRLQIQLRVLAPAGSAARHVIELTGLTEFVQVYDDEVG